ncbi:oligopeptide ABC transporter, substrate binding protein [Lacticaseibacillus thailandensis DSM 22698 = JCM 13996]|uniref:Oligopeptide ABC transporter, substrate binding protein n=1 Tax=Lacticaseibacillus thailandensis DSM 22698 = JCM 13996 TaxID=1423810 RepID=A0A0R2C5W9_9LACO|nr:oligopeptide ABC transporter, substrate binding protein [Lacticaseibacillus thailandensis DSM 22698 = JCM 13996]
MLAATAASVLLLAACGNSKASASATKAITVSIPSQLETLDGAQAADTSSGEVLTNVEEGLVVMGKHNKLQPGIAKSWTKSADGLTYTFELRHDAKWADGKPLNAHDFVYSWRRNVDPKTKAVNAYRYSGIKNADAINSGKQDPSTLGVQADGDYKLVVHLEHPMATFLSMMPNAEFLPAERSVVTKYGSKYGTNAAKTGYDGPYTLKSWNGTNDSWTLVKNNKYWNKKNVHLDKVTYQVVKTTSTGLNMFESGQLDQTELSGDEVKNEKNDKSFKQVLSGVGTYVVTNEKAPSNDTLKRAFNNVDIRKALSLSIDRKTFTQNTLADGSQPALGFVSRDLGQNPKTGTDFAQEAYVKNDPANSGVSYNRKLAQQYWAKGLKELGLNGLSFNLTVDEDDQWDQISQYLQEAWTKNLKGLKVTVKKVPKATRVKDLLGNDFDVILTSWSPDYDPTTFLDMMVTGNSYNFGGWSNSEYDSLMNTVHTTANETERWNDMVKAEKLLMKEQGVIPLYQNATNYLRNTKLTGMVDNAAGGNPGWRGVDLK